ncbi:hypothetical protein ACLB1G_21975 [Oxalobacteraceae bacterium A2-2]
MTTAIEFAKDLATKFAHELNAAPHEMQNWGKLGKDDELPAGDYAAIVSQFGECDRDTEVAYKDAFNATAQFKRGRP